MNAARFIELQDIQSRLTAAEIQEGWHFCSDWDYALVGPGPFEPGMYEHCSHRGKLPEGEEK